MTPATQASFKAADLKQFWTDRLVDAFSTGRQLAAEESARVAAVAASATPILNALLAEMLSSGRPQVQQQYLAGVMNAVRAEVAGVGGLNSIAATEELAMRTIQEALTFALNAAVGVLKIAILA